MAPNNEANQVAYDDQVYSEDVPDKMTQSNID